MGLPPIDCSQLAAPRLTPVHSLALVAVALSFWLGDGGIVAGASASESMNMALRGVFEPPNSDRRFGEVAAVGDFLLLATFQPWDESAEHGVYVIDASQPDSLALAAFVPTTHAARDISIADTLALVALEPVTAPGDPALLMLSIADPRAPRVLGAFSANSADMAHNAFFAPPYAYMANSRSYDLRIIDWSNTSAPFEAGRWKLDPPSILHDVMVSDTLAFLSYWDSGLVVLSVANPAQPYLVGRFSYSGAKTHSVALSPDRKTAYVTDERLVPPYGGMHILDISDLSNIREVGSWRCAGFDDSIHNLCVMGSQLYVSYYTCGVRVLDITSPREPREIAYYDMDERGQTTSGFWGIQPRAGTDLVYASHIEKGAIVLEARAFRSWRVAAGGGADFETIQSAIDAAGAGDTIRVEAGTYTETVALPGGMSLEGSGAATTVIDAGGRGRALTVTGGDNATHVAGLSLTGGRSPAGEGGGGLLLLESDAVVEYVSVFGNRADGPGGGALVTGGGPAFRGVRFLANDAASGGAIAIVDGANPTPVRLFDCDMLDNDAILQGGGLFSESGREVFLERCRIARNHATDGGGLWGASSACDLMNCIVAWNRADRAGGALGASGTYYRVENSVIADNSAPAGSALWGEGEVIQADINESVFARNAGASTFEASGIAPVSFAYSDFFANTGALTAGTIDPPQPSGANLFEDPRFVEPTWERLDYLPGLESPLIDAGNMIVSEVDLDSTRQDIGIGGGPQSGWVAPRLPPGLQVIALDNYDVCVCWTGSREPIAAYYHATDPALPVESSYRFVPGDFEYVGGGEWGIVDTTFSPSDTAAYYRMVPLDERGHSGSPSGILDVVPINLPPRPEIDLDPLTRSPFDSLEVDVSSDEPVTAATLILNGSRIEMESRSSSGRFWRTYIPRPNAEFVAIGEMTDAYGVVGIDSLRGDYIRLGPGREGSAFGTLFLSADVQEDVLLFAERREMPELPSTLTPVSDAFYFAVKWPRDAAEGNVDVRIVGPDALLPDERLVAAYPTYFPEGWSYSFYEARREIPDRVRSARAPLEQLLGAAAILLVAHDVPPPDQVRFTLSEPIPNPARGTSAVRFDITRWGGEPVWVGVYDVSGRLVRQVHDGPVPTGRYSIEWDGRDDRGELVPSGHYIISGRTGANGSSRHLTLIR